MLQDYVSRHVSGKVYGVPFGTDNWWSKMYTWRQAQPLLMYSKNTMMGAAMLKRHQFVRSLWALCGLVVSSITWGSQAQPLYFF